MTYTSYILDTHSHVWIFTEEVEVKYHLAKGCNGSLYLSQRTFVPWEGFYTSYCRMLKWTSECQCASKFILLDIYTVNRIAASSCVVSVDSDHRILNGLL